MKISNKTIACLLVIAVSLCCTSLQAATNWQTGTGDWLTAGNWDNGLPSATQAATIDNAGHAQLTTGNGRCDSLYVGVSSGNSGTVTVSNYRLDVDRYLQCGKNGGTGTLNVTGTASVYGSTNTWYVGLYGGTGTINIEDQSIVYNPIKMYIGFEAGQGAAIGLVTITDTAELSVGSTGTNADLFVANGGTATLEVDGSATLDVKGNLLIANNTNASRTGTVRVKGSGSGSIGATGDIYAKAQSRLCFEIDAGGVTAINAGGDFRTSTGAYIIPEIGTGLLEDTYTVLTWDGLLNDDGGSIALGPDVDTDCWSMDIDEVGKKITVTYVIPEPASMAILAIGGSLLVGIRRRRR